VRFRACGAGVTAKPCHYHRVSVPNPVIPAMILYGLSQGNARSKSRPETPALKADLKYLPKPTPAERASP
jgi:hypothetical protein